MYIEKKALKSFDVFKNGITITNLESLSLSSFLIIKLQHLELSLLVKISIK